MLNNIEKNEIVIANAETVNTNSEKRLLGVNYGLADIQAVDIDTSLLKSHSDELRSLEERPVFQQYPDGIRPDRWQ